MEFSNELFQKNGFKRFIVLTVLAIFLYVIRNLLDLFLLTFIFTYLMYRTQNYLSSHIKKVVRVHQKIIVVCLYLILASSLVLLLYAYVPLLVVQSRQVLKQILFVYKHPPNNPLINYLIVNLKQLDLVGYVDKGFDFLIKSFTSLSRWSFNIFVSLILSLYFLLDKNRIIQFTTGFETSNIGGYYEEIKNLGIKFMRSFGQVIEAQILIALANSFLSVIALWLMGFPQVLGLGIMIFMLGLIPVAGVIISVVPLCMIAYNIGGLLHVAYVLIMIAVLHTLESYILNPRLMSARTKLPVFYTFLVLIVSEHFLGIWGLIVGIPIFIFLLDVLEVSSG